MSLLPKEIISLVSDDTELSELCVQWSALGSIAVDTEFMRTDTFYPIIALIQVSDGDQCWLLDPLAINDFGPFKALLRNADVIKVFHACSEDLDVIKHALGVVPTPIFDTQVAAAFVGYGFSRGYSKLVSAVLGVELDKHETRSDWLQRPLREAQLGYAAEDVFYLAQVYQRLQAKLVSVDRLDWVLEDMRQLVAQAAVQLDLSSYYLKVKGAWQLNRKQVAVLKGLTQWREEVARAKNRPRSRVVPDKVLLEVARCCARSNSELQQISEMHPRDLRRYGVQLLDIVNKVLTSAADTWPEPLAKPLPRESADTIKMLRVVQNLLAEDLGIAPEILARKVDLEQLVRSCLQGRQQIPANWRNRWRQDNIGAALLAALPDTVSDL